MGKLISKVEIPAFIPRADLLDQLLRWAYIEVQENGVANTGTPCKVPAARRQRTLPVWHCAWTEPKSACCMVSHRTAVDGQLAEVLSLAALVLVLLQVTPFKRNDEIWGFTVSFLKDGVPAADIRVAFDEEVTQKHDWIGRGAGLLPRECSRAECVPSDSKRQPSPSPLPPATRTPDRPRAADGMPVPEGNAENILGKHFEIRKVCEREVNDNLRTSIREFCQVGGWDEGEGGRGVMFGKGSIIQIGQGVWLRGRCFGAAGA